MTPADAERAVEEQKAAGYDFVKIHGDLTAEAYAALIAAGRAHHFAITGHAPRNLSFDSVIAARQPLVAHAEELIYTKFTTLDTAGIGAVAERMAKAGIWLTPTLTTFSGIVRQWGRPPSVDSALALAEGSSLPEALRTYWKGSNPYTGRAKGADWAANAFRFQQPLVRALYRAGVPLLTGTDTPLPVMIPGHSLHEEIAELQRAGVDRLGALRAATVNPGRFIAEFVEPATRFGTISRGSRADLILAEGNPLDRPETLVHPMGVMARGRWYDRRMLDSLVAASGQGPSEPPSESAVAWSPTDRAAAAGEFRSETPTRTVRVTEKEGVLYLESPGQPVFQLTPIGARRLAAKGSLTKIEVEFDEAWSVLSVMVGGSLFAKLNRVR
jgi:imidazolonepropionase-like amidohydrolase